MSGTVGDNIARASGVVAAGGAGGAYTFIGSATASDSVSLDITSGIDSTYDVYLFVYTAINVVSDGTALRFRMSVGGSFITSSDYRYGGTWFSSASAYPGGNQQSDSAVRIELTYNGTSNDAAEPRSGMIWIYNPSSTSVWKNVLTKGTGMNQDGYMYSLTSAGLLENTSAVDGFQLSCYTDNITSGTVRCYGIANS